MKVTLELDISDKYIDRNFYVFAGIDLVAYKFRGGVWYKKISDCSMCGKCCRSLPNSFPFKLVDDSCKYLVKEPGDNDMWLCGLGIQRPHGCSVGESKIPECTAKYEKVE